MKIRICLENKYKSIINKPNFHIINLLFSFLSLIYKIIIKIRLFLYKINLYKIKIYKNVFIISIGNITLGGTGKTPMTKKIIEILKMKNEDNFISVISRGYKRKSNGNKIIKNNLIPNIKDIGDENFMLKRIFPQIFLGIGKNKSKIISKIYSKYPNIKYFIIDDGFQNLSIKKNLNILLIDATKNIFLDKLFPRGTMREPINNIKRANLIILTKCNISSQNNISLIEKKLENFGFDKKNNNLLLSQYIPINFENINGKILKIDEAKNYFENKRINSLSGIGNPISFSKILESLKIKIYENFIFPDHHWLSLDDIKKSCLSSDILLTTEKDFVKIKDLFSKDSLNNIKEKIFFVNMDIKFDNFYYEILKNKLFLNEDFV